MRRDQLEHAIRTACQIAGTPEVIVVGSQAILGTYREDELPDAATMSAEIDILPIADDPAETERLGDLIEGVAGEFSPFEDLHGFRAEPAAGGVLRAWLGSDLGVRVGWWRRFPARSPVVTVVPAGTVRCGCHRDGPLLSGEPRTSRRLPPGLTDTRS
jgi:hypothetical protein